MCMLINASPAHPLLKLDRAAGITTPHLGASTDEAQLKRGHCGSRRHHVFSWASSVDAPR